MTRACCLLPLALLLGACDAGHEADLHAWAAEIRQKHHPLPESVPQVAVVAAFRYEPAPGPDPFDPLRLSPVDGLAGGQLQPDLQRPREPLESWPLDSLRLVGSLRRERDVVALVEADKRVYSLRVGGHVGQDFGKVIAIGDKTVDIEELVAEGPGRWMKRRTQLVLQEKK